MTGSILGNSVLRREDNTLIRGQGTFVDNMAPRGAAFVKFVRSTVAHATIAEIDLADARAMPGVLGVFSSADLAVTHKPHLVPMFPESCQQPMLAVDKVRFVGEPVAVVVAETQQQAVDAAELVFVDYEPLEPIASVHSAQTGPRLFDDIENNIAFAMPGTPIDFADCEVQITIEIFNQRVAACPIEPRVASSTWDGNKLTHLASSQGSHGPKAAIVKAYDLAAEDVRVITRDVGGGFGAKGSIHAEELLIPELAKRVGRPVRWVEDRTENMTSMGQGRAQHQTLTVGGFRDGRVTHLKFDVLQDCGAYPTYAPFLPTFTMKMACSVYTFEHLEFNIASVYTTTTPITAYRGAGRPEAAAAIERALDVFATEIGMDPGDLRRRNFIPRDAFPHTTLTGAKYDSGDYAGALNSALEGAGYETLRSEQQRRRAAGDTKQLGIGIGSYVEVTAVGGGAEFGSVELRPDGTIVGRTGSTPYGQGHVTSWAMLLSDKLGLAMDAIEIHYGDTDEIPHSQVTGGSRSVQIAGSSIANAGDHLIELAREKAAEVLEAAGADVVFDRDNARFHVVGTPARSVDWADVARAQDEPLLALSDFKQAEESFPFGCHISVVEVDVETGAVTVLRHIAVDDAGTIINPMLAAGQVHGGIAQGVAQALLEEVNFDEDANPTTTNFADYAVISAAELPSFERIARETTTYLNPLGAKGIGEAGTIGSTPAVQNAIIDAVSHLGVRHIDMPCTPMRVWTALQAAG